MTRLAATDAATPAARPAAVSSTSRALFAALFLLALVPVLTTPIPAMSDYLNHLARMYVLAGQGKASPFYHVDWHFYPNLAMDLAVPGLGRWIGVELATRLFLLVSQILVVTGSLAIERQVKGHTETAGFVAILFLFNPPFAWGFLNFEVALGVALWGIAAWLVLDRKAWPIRLAVHSLFVAALFAGHMFALGLYGATLGLHELWRYRRERGSLLHLVATGALLAAPAAAFLVCMRSMGGSVGGDVNEWWLVVKPLWLFVLMNGDSTAVAAVGSIVLSGLVYAMVKRGEIAILQSGAWLACGFAILFVVVPGRLFDTAFADVRVLVGAVFVVPAFLSVEFRDRRMARIAAAVVVGLAVFNVATVERVWQGYQPIYRAMIAAFERLPPGARLLVAHTGAVDDPPFRDLADYPLYHAPTLAVPYAGAFVPTLFTTRGKQPLVVAADVQRLSFTDGGPAPLALLRAIAARPGKAGRSFISDWTKDFDYVCVLGTATGEPLPDALALVERGDSFVLYRVVRPAKS